MSKSLVIVESPAKAKTINKYLGSQYVVKSSVGHVRDLPTSGGNGKQKSKKKNQSKTLEDKQAREKMALVARMGVDPEHDWRAHYEILPGKEKVVAEIQKIANQVDQIFLATDLDREGEAIAWHLTEILGGDPSRFKRVIFNEITKSAIEEAFKSPGELNQDRVHAQQARRFLDRVVGYMVSPLLWKKIARGLSAGRVQSVAVRLIVEKEREIKAFVPEEYWRVHADFKTQTQQDLRMELTHAHDKPIKLQNEQQTQAVIDVLKGESYRIIEREEKPSSRKAPSPFTTSLLQQVASTRLGFGVKKTMMLAQRLYENGFITYMRTDSMNLSQEALSSVRDFIGQHYGDPYLPKTANVYRAKENAQEAHEAIRPTSIDVKAETLTTLDRDAQRLYDLIWRQFVACQMQPAQYQLVNLTAQAGDYQLKAKGRILQFDGWTRVLQPIGKNEDILLPPVQEGEILDLQALEPTQHFTKPPARFSEATLVKELEKKGIGRPSTYATIISTIQERGYVELENKRFYAEKMGEIVTDRLVECFADLINYDFTANMENKLDAIANGHNNWKDVLNIFYQHFLTDLQKAENTVEAGGMRANEPVLTDIKCPACQRQMVIRTASSGVFLGCSGYNLPPKERCKETINLMEAEHFLSEDEEAETQALRAMRRCHQCGTAMDAYIVDENRKLHVCGNNPDCPGYAVEQGKFKLKGYDGPTIECEKCGAQMQLREGRFGKFMACTNDGCKNTRKVLKNGEIAPPKEDPVHFPELRCEKSDAYFVLRDGAAGIFLAASTFPKSRETRAPLVEELVRFQDRLSPKHQYLAQAPVCDPDGNKAIVRFSRKNKTQYVTSEVNGKPSGWQAFYQDGQWVVQQTKKTKNS